MMQKVELPAKLEMASAAAASETRKEWMEITCAIILSLATTASAWCAYQSQLWGGAQLSATAKSAKAGRESTENTISAIQFRMFDAMMLIKYLELKAHGDDKLDAFLFKRFRPEMRPAMEAWLKTNPFTNPEAPQTPFDMPQYVQKQREEVKKQDAISAAMTVEADYASRQADTYLLLTVIFASVMFFGGISGTFRARQLQIVMSFIALILFLGTIAALATMPICPT